jgi:hypothetical protein
VASPASPRTPTTVLIGTVCPSATRISVRVPATGAGISASTLSVEISKMGSSRLTLSPTFFSHLVIVPSAIDSPIWGMMISVAIPPPPREIRIASKLRSFPSPEPFAGRRIPFADLHGTSTPTPRSFFPRGDES